MSRLADILGSSDYNNKVAERLYENIANVNKSLKAFVYVYENRDYYPVQILDLKKIARDNHAEFYSNVIFDSYSDDNLLFQFASILEKLNVGQPEEFFELAARKGNINAVRKVLSGDERKAYEMFLMKRAESQYQSYLKYMLQNSNLSSGEWYDIFLCTNDRHEELLSRSLGNMRYGYQYKRFNKLLRSYSSWDKVVVDKIIGSVDTMSPEYAAKIKKKLSSVKKMTGLYNIEANPLYRIVRKGYCDYPHKYVKSIVRENLWGTSHLSSSQLSYSSSSSSGEETKSVRSIDSEIMDYLRQHGGSISISASGTAISADGYTNLLITAVGDSSIAASVSGRTGNGVSFSNQRLLLTLRGGSAYASEDALKAARYISFSISFRFTGSKLNCYVSYTTASNASFYMSY